jgi:calcineurin-like phosphoesterase family protein
MQQLTDPVDPDRTFVVSDTHFGHGRILEYCPGRQRWAKLSPFMMDAKLIAAWNSVVGKDDTVFHIGDFSLVPNAFMGDYVAALNGKIHLVKGNHDRCTNKKYLEAGMMEVVHTKAVTVLGVPLFFVHSCHNDDLPVSSLFPTGSDSPKYLFHGHAHGQSQPESCRELNGIFGFDVGIDALCTTLTAGPVPAPLTLRKAVEYAQNYGKDPLQHKKE